jgi:two-component system cell cycle sensor histidine kinase/response regulator CckA
LSEQGNNDTITILLADDEELARTFAKDLLTMQGYSIIEAIDGEDAVRKFIDHKDEIRILLFDIAMPKKSGIDAYEEIRKFSPDVDVIFISGNTLGLESYHSIKDGAPSLIQKPYLPKQLFSVLNDVLGHKKPVSGHFFRQT